MSEHTRMLLRLNPRYALVRMLNDENNKHYHPDIFSFGTPVAVSPQTPTRTEVVMKADRVKIDDNVIQPYRGTINFRYNRIDLTAQFAGVLNGFRPTLPTSTQVLLDEITRVTGIDFYPEDIVLEEITRRNAHPYTIKAKTESLRFVGSIQVNVIDLQNLPDYLEDATSGSFAFTSTPQLRSVDINMPFINATPLIGQGLLRQFEDRSWGVNYGNLGTLLQKTIPLPGRRIDQLPPISWVDQLVPQSWNYAQAEVEALDNQVSSNAFIPRLNRAIRVVLNDLWNTNLNDPTILIPYYRFDEMSSEFATTGKMRYPATWSLTDATAWNQELSPLVVGDILGPPFFEIMHFEILPEEVWNFWPEPNKWNLRDAVVQYNGELERFMAKPLDDSLNRVLIVTLSDYNTVYSGNFSIFYKAAIELNTLIAEQQLGEETDHDFTPTGGTGPYVTALETGALADGHSIVDNHLTGAPTIAGNFEGTLRVTDANNVVAYQKFAYRVV